MTFSRRGAVVFLRVSDRWTRPRLRARVLERPVLCLRRPRRVVLTSVSLTLLCVLGCVARRRTISGRSCGRKMQTSLRGGRSPRSIASSCPFFQRCSPITRCCRSRGGWTSWGRCMVRSVGVRLIRRLCLLLSTSLTYATICPSMGCLLCLFGGGKLGVCGGIARMLFSASLMGWSKRGLSTRWSVVPSR